MSKKSFSVVSLLAVVAMLFVAFAPAGVASAAPITGTLDTITPPGSVSSRTFSVPYTVNVAGTDTTVYVYAHPVGSAGPFVLVGQEGFDTTTAGNVEVNLPAGGDWSSTTDNPEIEWAAESGTTLPATPAAATIAGHTNLFQGVAVSMSTAAWINPGVAAGISVTYTLSNQSSIAIPVLPVTLFARAKASPATDYTVALALPAVTLNAGGSITQTRDLTGATLPTGLADGDQVEWLLAATDDTAMPARLAPMASSKVDMAPPWGFATVAPEQTMYAGQLPACQPAPFYALFQDPVTPATTGVASGFGKFGFSPAGYALPAIVAGLNPAAQEFIFSLSGMPTSGALNLTALDQAGNGNTYSVATWSSLSSVPVCPTFSDEPATDQFAPYVGFLAQMGVIKGTTATTFAPNDNITRAQFAILLARALNGGAVPDTTPTATCVFSDVPSAANGTAQGELYDAVSWGCTAGLIKGYTSGAFGWNDPLTRGQAVLLLSRTSTAIQDADITVSDTSMLFGNDLTAKPFAARSASFTDVNMLPYGSVELISAINTFYGAGIIDGYNSTTFGIFDPISRGQLSKILYRALSDVAVTVAP
jgi:hypothetical protein